MPVRRYRQKACDVRAVRFELPFSLSTDCQMNIGGAYQLTAASGDWLVLDPAGNLSVYPDSAFREVFDLIEEDGDVVA